MLEPRAHVRWSERDGHVFVEQVAGRTFYRVDEDSAFTVTTPAGVIDVTGTCFEVDVSPSFTRNQRLAGGIATAAIVAITIYEGSVRIGSDDGETTADAGTTVVLEPGQRPRASESSAANADVLVAQTRQLVRDRRDRVRRLERELRAARAAQQPNTAPDETPQQRAERCIEVGGTGCDWVEPSPELLDVLAECGLTWTDHPSAVRGDVEPSDAFANAAGLTSTERATLREANEAYRQADEDAMREFFVELGGDASRAPQLSINAVRGWLDAKVPPEAVNRVSRAIARERAGLDEPPHSAHEARERYVRYLSGDGDRYEAFVATRLGEARARDLRLTWGHWPGSQIMLGAGCE